MRTAERLIQLSDSMARGVVNPLRLGDEICVLCAHIGVMNYVLALLLPPLSILLAGRPIVAFVVFLVWLPAILISGGLGHPIFIVLAWIIIFQAQQDRRAER